MRKKKPSAKLENWAVVLRDNIAAYRTLEPGYLLVGRVFGHPTIAEGRFIFTSPIVHLDSEAKVAETANTAYRLGEASTDYQAWSEQNSVAA